MKPWWNDPDRGKPKNLGEKPDQFPLCPPQIPHGLTWASEVRDQQLLLEPWHGIPFTLWKENKRFMGICKPTNNMIYFKMVSFIK
jgi:hypothetical protein